MRHLTKGSSKTIEIRLNEEKFYFPGEIIKGSVIVHPKSPTKTNHITLRFAGEVFVSVKDKETITLFQKTETIAVSKDRGKTHVLDAKQHSFDFEFAVPDDLPSTMELGKRKARIRYWLTAIHDRPMVPESLCSKAEYTVPILEFVDVQSPLYNKVQEEALDFALPQLSKRHRQCQLRVSMPRFGFTRGDLVKLSIVFNHFESFTRKNAVKVDLVRVIDIRTARNTLNKEDILKSADHDVNIIGPYNFSQAINSQILIPTSTPPTIRYKDKIIDIHYKIRVRLYLEKKKSAAESQLLEMPIVIGTWPRADVPIDDEDDDDYENDRLVSDDDDDDDDNNNYDIIGDSDFSLPPHPTQSSSSKTTSTFQPQHRRNVSSSLMSPISASTSTVTLTLRNTHISEPGVMRSDSNASHSSRKSQGSEKSWRSSQSWEQRSPTLSRNTSASTNLTAPEPYGRSMVVPAGGQAYLNRSSSTPDLLTNPPPPPPAATPSGGLYPARPPANNRSSYYDANSVEQQQQQQQQYYPRSPTYQPRQPPDDYAGVPTHVLQPLQSSSSRHPPSTPSSAVSPPAVRTPHRDYNYSYYDDLTDSDPDDSDDSDDDGDLLRIIEKKKKQEERMRRARGGY